jgi:hypothetical protein
MTVATYFLGRRHSKRVNERLPRFSRPLVELPGVLGRQLGVGLACPIRRHVGRLSSLERCNQSKLAIDIDDSFASLTVKPNDGLIDGDAVQLKPNQWQPIRIAGSLCRANLGVQPDKFRARIRQPRASPS